MNSSLVPTQSKAIAVAERRARQNALLLLVLFLLQPIAAAVFIATRLAGSIAFNDIYFWIRDFGVIGGLYAIFFMPVRWRLIRAMPKFSRISAYVGGGGLIVFLLINLPGIWRAL